MEVISPREVRLLLCSAKRASPKGAFLKGDLSAPMPESDLIPGHPPQIAAAPVRAP